MKTKAALLLAFLATVIVAEDAPKPQPAPLQPPAEAVQPAPAPAQQTAPAPAQTAAVPVQPQADADEIDLEEDDAALAAKRPSVKSVKAGEEVSLVDINCDDATLADILRQFRKATSANIISDDSTNLLRRVSVKLTRVPWLDALQAILNSRGFRLEERGNIYFVNEDKQLIPIVTKTFQLNHASSEELARLFNENYAKKDATGKIVQPIANAFPGANVVVVTGAEKVISDCEAIVKSVDKAVTQIYIEARFLSLSSEAAHKLGMKWNQLESWGMTAKNLKTGWEYNNGRANNFGTGLSQKSQTTSTTKNNSISSTDSQNSTSSKNDSKNVSAGSGGASTVSSSSSSATSQSPSQNRSTTQNNNLSDSISEAFTSLFPDGIKDAAGAGISSASMGWRNARGFSGQLSADDFSLAMSAFESLGEGKLFSNPKIIVSNGKEARVDMTTKYPNVTVTSQRNNTSGSSELDISTKLEVIPGEDKLMFAKEAFYSWGIQLTVKPRISPDGLISVEIVPTISNLDTEHGNNGFYSPNSGKSTDAAFSAYPILSVKRLVTEFTMKDGATAVIGGLSQTTEQDVDSGIPYLRKIPWIGSKLFGWKSRQKVQEEIIVCVTIGIANPADLPRDIGLPTNAILGREYVHGNRKEPGLRNGSAADVLKLDMRTIEEIKKGAPKKEPETVKIEIPAKEDTTATGSGTVTVKPSGMLEDLMPEPEAKPSEEAKPESKLEPKTEPEPKPEAKPEPKTEAKPEAKPEPESKTEPQR